MNEISLIDSLNARNKDLYEQRDMAEQRILELEQKYDSLFNSYNIINETHLQYEKKLAIAVNELKAIEVISRKKADERWSCMTCNGHQSTLELFADDIEATLKKIGEIK